MFDPLSYTLVERRDSYTKDTFTVNYKDTAKPVILSSLMADWPATAKWSVNYLKTVAGNEIVPVYSSKPAKNNEHQHAAAQTMRLRDYLELLENGENDLRMFFYNILQGVPDLLNDFNYPDLGMKFFKRLPVLFVGGKGARVQMHYDIDLADLVLCHFGGPKKVLLIPPEQTPFMYKVPFSFSALYDVDFSQPDFAKYPALKQLHGYVAELKHGDALYIPSGYWHYIVYDDIGFSMTLRSMPTALKRRAQVLKNIIYTRSVEGLMRKVFGQKWNDRNERLAVDRTHATLNTESEAP